MQSEQPSRVVGKESSELQRFRSWPLKISRSTLKVPRDVDRKLPASATTSCWSPSSLMTRTPGFNFPVCSGSRGFSFLCFMFKKILTTFVTYLIKLLFLMCVYRWKEVYLDQSSCGWNRCSKIF